MTFQTREVSFEVAGWASKLFDVPTRQGHKYCITVFDTEGTRYRMYSFTRTPTLKHNGWVVSLNRGDRINGLVTVTQGTEGELLGLVWSSLHLV